MCLGGPNLVGKFGREVIPFYVCVIWLINE
jgi:hypothetical protein